jgi:large subunit ribosomal protein L13
LGRQLIKKLKVYRGPEHPHQAQMPEVLNLKKELSDNA